MTEHELEQSSTTGALPIAPSLGPALAAAQVPARPPLVDRRVLFISFLALILAGLAGLTAELLLRLIAFVTNIAFFGSMTFAFHSASANRLGLWVIPVPIIGGIIVGFMARYGSRGIRGHGIPEAMEQVLLNQSRIPPRLTFLKPLSAAISIGTGGPFGAEGPIIATGGAMGSLLGQLLRTTADERKVFLAAGAAAGMAATFGSPVSAVLLAIELLLFEFRPRSIIPVALASTAAAAVRAAFHGMKPMFAMPDLLPPPGTALTSYIVIGALIGLAAVGATRAIYFVEDAFERIPLHWMWYPALGGIAVGVIGYFHPRTLSVGYDNITDLLGGNLTLAVAASLCIWKFISWSIALGSGTSGGTLAPLFTVGGGLGAVLGVAAAHLMPHGGIDPRIAAMVGMAAIFAGASRAMLTSAVFAFETTLQPLGLMPLLGGCTAAYLVSCLLMRNTIMTEKIVRRGVRVPSEYHADFLDSLLVRDVASKDPMCLLSGQTVGEVRAWVSTGNTAHTHHQGFPILDSQTRLIVGVLTRRDLLDPAISAEHHLGELIKRPPSVVYDDLTLREAADHMVNHDIGRLPVVTRELPGKVIGMLTRSDLLGAHRQRLTADRDMRRSLDWRRAVRPSQTASSEDS